MPSPGKDNEEKCPTNALAGWALLELTDALLRRDSIFDSVKAIVMYGTEMK